MKLMEIIKPWLSKVLNLLMIGLVTVAVLVLTTILWSTFFNQPPLTITSADPSDLGIICPGQTLYIHNEVSINDPIIAFYYLNVMDKTSSFGYSGTQQAFVDNLYPHKTSFTQVLAWKVPMLGSGEYQRVFAARNNNGNQRTIFIQNSFTIGDDCGKPSSNYRSHQDGGISSCCVDCTDGLCAYGRYPTSPFNHFSDFNYQPWWYDLAEQLGYTVSKSNSQGWRAPGS